MLFNRLYYTFKPYIPRRVRIAVRQSVARQRAKRHADTWPINPTTAQPPRGWQGWPKGKKFAFVITHDVEDIGGLAKCRQLYSIERSLGFRSSFNFIPEGPYRVPAEFRTELQQAGFEVGVHDLKHDGKLFRSREEFARSAKKISEYARAWDAKGYRSGFMLRQLDWLHDLDIVYDASTFDTDPFEPMPDGAGTIFPFWIPTPAEGQSQYHDESGPTARSRGGYVELPYTLVQDSTAFLLLRERDPAIWTNKLDWIAQNGGMALVNVHPDYLQFPNESASKDTFPVDLYVRLLRHVLEKHGDDVWLATASEVAKHVQSMDPLPQAKKNLRVCMVTHSHYASDTRVIRYAEALAARGDHVDVIGLRDKPSTPVDDVLNGVHVHKLQDRFGKQQNRPLDFLLPILSFWWKSARWIAKAHREKSYDVFHIHNIPDFLVFAARGPRRKGAKVILDIHDLVPEFYSSKFAHNENSLRIRLLKWMERVSAKVADHVIIANHLWLDKYRQRTNSADKCSVFINNVDETVFKQRPKTRTDGKLIMMFPGGLQWHQGLDIAIRAMPQILATVPNVEFHIYGDGIVKPQLVQLAKDLGLQNKVLFFPPVKVSEIAVKMADADLAVVPKRAESFGNEAYSTKIMEFMSLGVPLVISSTKIDRYYFTDEVVRFFKSGDENDLARQAIAAFTNHAETARMAKAASAYAEANCWGGRFKTDYLNLVDSLAKPNGAIQRPPQSVTAATVASEETVAVTS